MRRGAISRLVWAGRRLVLGGGEVGGRGGDGGGVAELIWLLMFAAFCSAREGEEEGDGGPFLGLGTRYSGMGLSEALMKGEASSGVQLTGRLWWWGLVRCWDSGGDAFLWVAME